MTAKIPKEWDRETDVLVIGAGTAGLPAGIAVKEAGAEVLVLESTRSCGGSGNLIAAGGSFAGTPLQKKLGVADSPERLYQDGVEVAEGAPELWRTYADHQLDTYYWLVDIGAGPVRDDMVMAVPGHRVPRMHLFEGMKAMAAVEKDTRAHGVEILMGHRATRLVYDWEQERVIGAQVQVGDKVMHFRARKAVLLTAGSFGRSKEMLAEYGKRFLDCMPLMAPGHLGDGLRMGLDLGAATKDIGNAVVASLAVCTTTKSDRPLFAVVSGGIAVNVNGERFYDESCPKGYYGHLTDAGLDQPGKVFWLVYNQKILEMPFIKDQAHSWHAFEGKTPEELANNAGFNAENFVKTLARYNDDIESEGYDTVFGRKRCTWGGAEVFSLEGHYYAVKCVTSITSFKGGLRVNGRFQVVNQYGEAIKGLYAAGEVIGGLFAKGAYLGGVNWSSALTFGRVAGRNAAFEVVRRRPATD
jgi:fumarate reductase flavoprotein subunit